MLPGQSTDASRCRCFNVIERESVTTSGLARYYRGRYTFGRLINMYINFFIFLLYHVLQKQSFTLSFRVYLQRPGNPRQNLDLTFFKLTQCAIECVCELLHKIYDRKSFPGENIEQNVDIIWRSRTLSL